MTIPRVHHGGFTLLELLVATTLTLIVVTTATTALNQMLKMVRRVQALQDMNNAAALIHNRLTKQVSSMHPCTAMWLSQDASDTSVELVFMHGVENSGTPMFNTDQRWTRWHWSKDTGILNISSSRGERNFLMNASESSNYWQVSPKLTNTNRFMLVPQPLRDPGTGGPKTPLDANRWNTDPLITGGAVGDIGDYTDLLRNAVPVLQNCTACTIEIVDIDGNSYPADGSLTGIKFSSLGAFVDGRSYANRGRSPSIVRLRFTQTVPYLIGNPKTTVQATYSFSANTPHDISY